MEKVKDDVAVGGSERTRNNVLDDVHEILYEYFGASTQEVMHKSLADLAYNLAMLVPIEMTAADIKARVTKILESVGVLAGLPKGAKWNCFQHPRDELSERSRAARKRKIMALVGGGLLAAGLTAGGIALLASGSGSAPSTTTTLDKLRDEKAKDQKEIQKKLEDSAKGDGLDPLLGGGVTPGVGDTVKKQDTVKGQDTVKEQDTVKGQATGLEAVLKRHGLSSPSR